MNAVILYDSEFGNTERLAFAVAAALEETGSVRLVRAGDELDLDSVELLVVGGPTQRHGVSPRLRAAIEALPPLRLKAAVFDTRYRRSRFVTGSAAVRVAKCLRRKGASVLVAPESFFVGEFGGPLEAGEVERAYAWGELIAPTKKRRAEPPLLLRSSAAG